MTEGDCLEPEQGVPARRDEQAHACPKASYVAVHEAGHVVMARLRGFAVERVRILADHHGKTDIEGDDDELWVQAQEHPEAVREDRVLISLAGYAAGDLLHDGRRASINPMEERALNEDRNRAHGLLVWRFPVLREEHKGPAPLAFAEALDSLESLLEDHSVAAKQILAEPGPSAAVRAVAEALDREGELSGEQIESLISEHLPEAPRRAFRPPGAPPA